MPVCEKCNTFIEEMDKFCKKCGANLNKSLPPPPPPPPPSQYGTTYQQPYYDQQYYMYYAERRFGNAMGGLGIIFGIIGIFILGIIFGIIAIVLGSTAVNKYAPEAGYIAIALGIIDFIGAILALIFLSSMGFL